eukprot:g2684.t1
MVLEGTVSYRQVGRNTSLGNVAKKKRKFRPPRTAASIPSKFETTLHVGRTERNGFGGRTFRFSSDSTAAAVPAPGSYHRAATLVRRQATCGSISRAGYGTGFVSKDKRFAAATAREVAQSLAPGPASYRPEPLPTQTTQSAAGSTANFAQPRRYRDEAQIPMPTELVPGPGEYYPDAGATARPTPQIATSAASSFRSGTVRGTKALAGRDAPPPNRYTIRGTFGAVQPALAGGQAATLPQASFRSTGAKVSKELFYPEETARGKLPGAGQYDAPEAHRAARTDLVGLAQSSSTFSNMGQDRFGRPYERKVPVEETPGPGWYGREAERPRGVAASSFFMSSSRRTAGAKVADVAQLPPGPAYYTPVGSLKKSFLLNPTSRWV